MQMELKNPKSGEVKVIEIDEQVAQQIKNSLSPGATKSKLHDAIDKFNVSAEVKALLFSLADLTIKIGNTSVFLGQKMLELVAYFVKQYPKTTLGLVVGSVIALIINSIPVIGWVAGWIITPLCLALGLAVGFWGDLQDKQFEKSIKDTVTEMFASLKHVAA